jgi:hypothetical protein
MHQIYATTPKLPPPPQNGGSEPKQLYSASPRAVDLPLLARYLVKENNFDSPLAQPTGENVILVEENNRLESFSIDSHSQIKERLVRPADSSVLIAFDKQHTCWPGTGRGRG